MDLTPNRITAEKMSGIREETAKGPCFNSLAQSGAQ